MGTQTTLAPFSPSLSIRAGRDAYLAENGFSLKAYDAEWSVVSLFGVSISIPNTKGRRAAIRMHDLHHVVTGFGTDLVGEAEISAWELRRGLRGLGPFVRVIVVGVTLFGLLGVAPRRTVRAWKASRSGGSLFQTRRGYEELLSMTVGELRRELGVPEGGLAAEPRR
jgi:hypothetical protein